MNKKNSIILHDNARIHTAADVTDLLCRWQWDILEHTCPKSPCDYDLFGKVREPLGVIRYNARYELILTIGLSIRNINKDGRADGV